IQRADPGGAERRRGGRGDGARDRARAATAWRTAHGAAEAQPDRPDRGRTQRHGSATAADDHGRDGLRLPAAVRAPARNPGRRGRPDAGRGRLLQPAGSGAAVGADERGQWRTGAAGILVHPSQPRYPHPEPDGVDAQGDGIPAEILRNGGQRRREVNRLRASVMAAACAALVPLAARAEVKDAAPSGCTIENTEWVPATPAVAWTALVEQVGQWWPADHTWW